MLATAIRSNKNIRVITVKKQECKISQYADDSTLILDGSVHSVGCTLDLLEKLSIFSGLKVNYDKTEALWIGSKRNSNLILFREKEIRWPKDKVYALGVWFSATNQNIVYINYEDKLEKMKNILKNWNFRRLTLIGNITVILTLAISQLVYIMSSLPTCPKVQKEVNKLLFEFLWDGKKDKIKRSVLLNTYEKGGLKMVDLKVSTNHSN